MTRTTLGFIVAPLWVPVTVLPFSALEIFPDSEQLHWVAISAIISAIFGYAGTLLLGLPGFVILRAHGFTSWWVAIFFGFVMGSITFVAFLALFGLFFGSTAFDILEEVTKSLFSFSSMVPGLIGAVVGLTLWLMARPDKRTTTNRHSNLP